MTAIEADTGLEARRLAGESAAAEVPLWLLGGGAVQVLVGDAQRPELTRSLHDVDFITVRGARAAVDEFLTGCQYEPDEEFNALHGHRRLLFHERVYGRQVDVFVDTFRMCHGIPLTGRLVAGQPTIPLAELLLTKLQIVKLNEKDRLDLYALLLAFEVGDGDRCIDRERIGELCANDWGLSRTTELNLERLRDGLEDGPLAPRDRVTVADRIEQLTAALERAPKSVAWRLRARVGDRVTWYDEPEEVGQ
jgi:hypothetical protein